MNPVRTLVALALLLLTPLAHAFDLQQLSDQLAKPAVIHGAFVQEKHLRALPQPLTSKGNFVLAKASGLLWLLDTPLKQDYTSPPPASPVARPMAAGRCCRVKAQAPSRTGCFSPSYKVTAAACNVISTCS